MNQETKKALVMVIGFTCQMGAIWGPIGLYELTRDYEWAFILSGIIASVVIWTTVSILKGKEVSNA